MIPFAGTFLVLFLCELGIGARPAEGGALVVIVAGLALVAVAAREGLQAAGTLSRGATTGGGDAASLAKDRGAERRPTAIRSRLANGVATLRPRALRPLGGAALGAAITAGALVFLLRGGRVEGPERAMPGVAIPAAVQGIVAGPAMTSRERCRIPLADGAMIVLPASLPGPLPGAELRALCRLSADGRELLVPSTEFLEVVRPPPPAHIGATVERARRWLRARLASGTSPGLGQFLRTLLLGDRGIDPEARERFARTGTLHLLAVSGMHLILLLGLLRKTLGPGPKRLLAGIFVYATVTGFASPIGRAILTAAFALLARALGRRPRPATHLLVTLALVLAWDARSAHEPGFILSFSAYAGILLGAVPILERWRRDPFRNVRDPEGATSLRARFREALLVSVCAWGASLIPTLLLFQRVSPAAIPGSIVLGPVVNLLLVVGLVLVVVPGFPPAVALADALVRAVDLVVLGLDRCPGGTFDVAVPPTPAVVLAAASFVVVFVRAASGRPLRGALVAAALAHLLLGAAPGTTGDATLFPAGRGSALLATAKGRDILVDVGPASKRIDRRVLEVGVGSLALLLLSHDHQDHAGGAAAVLSALAPSLRRSGFPKAGFERATAGDAVLDGVRILWPPPGDSSAETNDRSLAVHLVTDEAALLATGDLETAGLSRLLRRGPLPRSDVVLVPHHGGRNDALVDLLIGTSPEECWLAAWPGTAEPATLLAIAALGLPLRSNDRGPIATGARDR